MKKILILTVDCWNTKNAASSATTYSTLFTSMSEYELYNIYIREELPDDPCCKRYFQISERRIIKGLFNRKIKSGKEVKRQSVCSEADNENINKQKDFYDKQRNHFYYTKKMIREIIWFLSKWKSKELDDYLEQIKPDIVLFAMEGYIHFNRICRYVIKKTGAKSIGYFWDDNFTYRQRPNNLGYKVFRFFQRKSLKKLAKFTDQFWAISPKTKIEADCFFGIDCIVLPKPTERDTSVIPKNESDSTKPLKMMYAGNLMIGRINTIKALAEVLKFVNSSELKVVLDVYTSTKIPDELKNYGYGIVFHDPVSTREVLELQDKSRVLLFVEDIVGAEKKVARLSISTKVPDLLSSGKCIFALGDYDTASMEYFYKEKTALCAQNKAEILDCINVLLECPDVVKEYSERAFDCAKRNHSKDNIKNLLSENIRKVLVSDESCSN